MNSHIPFPPGLQRIHHWVIRPHSVFLGFLDYVIHNFILININVSLFIRLYIKASAGGIVIHNHIKDIIQIILREFIFQILRQIIFDKLYRF